MFKNEKIYKTHYLSTDIYLLQVLQSFEKENLYKHKIALFLGKCLHITFYFILSLSVYNIAISIQFLLLLFSILFMKY